MKAVSLPWQRLSLRDKGGAFAFVLRWKQALFFVYFVALLFGLLLERQQMVHYGYEIERLTVEKNLQNRHQKELLVEVKNLSRLERIEKIATEQLQMRRATPGQRIYVP